MPTFCRHGRFLQNCSICREPDAPASATRSGGARRPSSSRGGSSRGAGSAGVVVRRAERAQADGYESPLLPGLNASGDAQRLARELAFSAGRLAQLATDPPQAYAEAASGGDVEEAVGRVFELTVRGPRGVADPEATLAAYRAWAERSGGALAALTGETVWTPERRFDRGFDRLSLPGLGRAPRYEFLVAIGRLGLVDMRGASLELALADEVNVAAKRVFGIGDPLLLDRRAAALAESAEVPIEAFDLALYNWNFNSDEDERVRMGAPADAEAGREQIDAALGL